MIKIFHKHKKSLPVDNYDKICHLLSLEYRPDFGSFVGICSLCGKKNFNFSHRCSNCRAKIEDDCKFY